MNHSRWVYCIFWVCGLLPLKLKAAGSSISFYDPSRPGRHPVASMVVPNGPGGPSTSKPVAIYALVDLPAGAAKDNTQVSVSLNGKPENTVRLIWSPSDRAKPWVKIKATVPPGDLKYGASGAENRLQVAVKKPDGTTDNLGLVVTGASFPALEQSRVEGTFLGMKDSDFTYSLAYRVPPSPMKIGSFIEPLGKYGVTLQLRGKITFTPADQSYFSETIGGASIFLGDRDWYLELGSKDEGSWEGGKWVKTNSKAYVGLSTSFTPWEKTIISIMPKSAQDTIDYIPLLGPKFKKTLQEIKLSLTITPSLYGEADLALEPADDPITRWYLGGSMDVRLAASAIVEVNGFGKFGAQVMVGGQLDLAVKKAKNEPFRFKRFNGELYVGGEFYFLAFESQFHQPFANFYIPSKTEQDNEGDDDEEEKEDTQQASPPKSAPVRTLTDSNFQLVPPPPAKENLEYAMSPLRRSAPRAGAASLAASQALFRRLGTERVLRRGGLKPINPGSQPVIEGGAVVPLAFNTTSVVWPSVASHIGSGGMLVLFGVDTRPAGSQSTSAQFSKIRWTYCKNGTWTQAQPVPAGNGAAQIAPVVAPVCDAKPIYVAAWQQLQNPNFRGTGLIDWLDQTQVEVGIFQAEDGSGNRLNKWTTQLLGAPDRADISPKVSGYLGGNYEDAMVVWLSAKLSDVRKSDGKGIPDGAEFRFAVYRNGKWQLPDYSKSPAYKEDDQRRKQFPRVPKGLLSWDYSIRGSFGYLVYSEDLGNNKSRIMTCIYHDDPKDLSQSEWFGPFQLSKVEGQNLNPKIIMPKLYQIAVAWMQNGDLVTRIEGGQDDDLMQETFSTVRAATEGPVPPDAKLTLLHKATAGDSDLALSWTEQTTQGPSIMTSVFDYNGGGWSKPMAITPGEDLETLYAATTDAMGNLVPLYVHTDISVGNVQVPDDQGQMVTMKNAPIAGPEKLMIGRFRPTRDLKFAPGGLTTTSPNFAGGSTVKLIARVKSEGMLGFPSVSVAFYHGDPKKGGKLIGVNKSTKPLPGGGTVDITMDWKLAEDLWDRENSPLEVYAVIQKPQGVTEWNPNNNTTMMHVDEIFLEASASAEKARQDGSAMVEVEVRNSGFPSTQPFPVKIYDYTGTQLLAHEMVTRVEAGGVSRVNLELPPGTVHGADGRSFLVKIDPDNTLKLPDSPKVETKVHIYPAAY